MKQSRLKPMSAKKRRAKSEELKVYVECAKRAKCVVVVDDTGTHWPGGYCEDCGEKQHGRILLHPHHKIFRSQGGKTTEENIKMVCPDCHARLHNINVVKSQPMWSRKEG